MLNEFYLYFMLNDLFNWGLGIGPNTQNPKPNIKK